MYFTTLDRIISLYAAERELLDRACDDYFTAAERQQFADIHADLALLWCDRRKELVFEVAGPPRLVSAPDPRSVHQVARFARGMAPLPSGGD